MTIGPMTIDRPRIAVLLGGFTAFLSLYAPQSVLPQLAGSFHLTVAAAGAAVGVSTLAVAISAPFVGMLSDRLGRKRTIAWASLLLIIPTVLLSTSQSFDAILFYRFLQGLLVPAIFSPLVAYVSEEWEADSAADVMGLYISGAALGGFSGRFVSALAADHFGWRLGFGTLALLSLFSAALIIAWLPAGRPAAPSAGVRVSAGAALLDHMTNKALLATCAVGFAVLFSMTATFTYVNFHLAAPPFNLGTSALGEIFLVYPIGAAAAPMSGTLIRRMGRRQAVALALSLSCLGLLFTLVPDVRMIVLGLAFYVVGCFIAQSAAMGFVGITASHAKGAAVGFYVCCYYIGGSIGAVLPGLLIWKVAGWRGCVALVFVTMAGAALLAWHAWKERRFAPSGKLTADRERSDHPAYPEPELPPCR